MHLIEAFGWAGVSVLTLWSSYFPVANFSDQSNLLILQGMAEAHD